MIFKAIWNCTVLGLSENFAISRKKSLFFFFVFLILLINQEIFLLFWVQPLGNHGLATKLDRLI